MTTAVPLTCARCAADLRPGSGNFYRITIEAVADPGPPILADEPAEDIRDKIKHLIDHLQNISEQDAMAQVYRRLLIYLCAPCFRQWIEHPAGR